MKKWNQLSTTKKVLIIVGGLIVLKNVLFGMSSLMPYCGRG